jgi:hypothetical protein
MKCCLWLNGRKVCKAADIKDNFDLISLRGYFIGGSLKRWLESNGGNKYAKKLRDFVDEKGFPAENEIAGEILQFVFGLQKNKPQTKTESTKKVSEYTLKNVTAEFFSLPGSFAGLSSLRAFNEWYKLQSLGSLFGFSSARAFEERYGLQYLGSFAYYGGFYEFFRKFGSFSFRYYGSFSPFEKQEYIKFRLYEKIKLRKAAGGSFARSMSFRFFGSFGKLAQIRSPAKYRTGGFPGSSGSFNASSAGLFLARFIEIKRHPPAEWKRGFREENTEENNRSLTENLVEKIVIYEQENRDFNDAEAEIILDLELFYEWNPLDRFGYGIFLI